jgi:subtilisin family serine protease
VQTAAGARLCLSCTCKGSRLFLLRVALLPADAQVGVVDSGVDGSHPDINYVGGKAWVVPSTAVPGDVADPNVDMYGECGGTRLAGVASAAQQCKPCMLLVLLRVCVHRCCPDATAGVRASSHHAATRKHYAAELACSCAKQDCLPACPVSRCPAGHGTHVAGIIGDKNGGAGGVVGVAPGVGIYSLKILDAQGVGEPS